MLKRLKNTEGKNERQLDLIGDQEERQLDLIGKINTDKTKSIGFYDRKNKDAIALVNTINKVIENIDGKKFVFVPSKEDPYDFNKYTHLNQFGNNIYSGKTLLNKAKNEQYEMLDLMNKLKGYNAGEKKSKYEVLHNTKKVYNTRINIINAFEDGTFPKKPDKQEIDIPELESEEPKEKIPEWVEISDYAFDRLKDKIDNAVDKNLGPMLGKKKVNYLHLQGFLRSILDGEFNDREQARKYFADNIYDEYRKKKKPQKNPQRIKY